MARILVADDNTELASLISRSLTRKGHEVVLVDDGRKALAEMARQGFDLLITDIVMPEVGGLDLLRELRRTPPHARVIAMSGGGRGSAEQYLELAPRAACRFGRRGLSNNVVTDCVVQDGACFRSRQSRARCLCLDRIGSRPPRRWLDIGCPYPRSK